MAYDDFLMHKLALLAKIEQNTRTQLRFVRRHEMRGLTRLLRERAKLLHHLTLLNAELAAFSGEPLTEGSKALKCQIREKEEAILACNEMTVQAAKEEQNSLAESLRDIRRYRQLCAGYYRPGDGYTGGGWFNKKV